MNRKIIFSSLLLSFLLSISISVAQTHLDNSQKIYIQKATNPSEPSGIYRTSLLKIDNQNVEDANLQWNVMYPFQQTAPQTKSNDYTNKRILKPGEAIIFEVNNNNVVEDSSHFPSFSQEVKDAIARVPAWLHYDLKFKFRMATSSSVQTKMVNLLNSTPKQYLDEVAFTLAYLPYEVLSSSRFSNDWDYLIKNAELIYTIADSLKYVRLIEKGDTNTNDWKTTTEYKIKKGGSYEWREIDPYYYYQFIVMPKIEQEGLYVTDNTSSVGQRTWGYGWREYLWFDPDSSRSYQPVNISGYKIVDASGRYDSLIIDTIPRLGEIMQMPEYLWDEVKTLYMFNREFKPNNHALDVLGNWCSRCIPMDVTSASDYRPSQPNHIAWKHIGNCHEDALLVAAAARTCLIPLMHIGDFCDDHVWGMFHDGGGKHEWNHYEFFRGGCSPGRPYYWGMTNMQEYAGYGWNSSLVQGYVPDGTQINVSDYYSKNKPSSMLDLTIVDSLGKPIDGVRVKLYSTNTQYGTPYTLYAGYLWTDAMGRIHTPIGTGKKYYMKVYHPKYGTFPEEESKIYILLNTNTTSDKTYTVSFTMPTTAKKRTRVNFGQDTYDAEKSLKISFAAKNITTDNNPIDGQRSTFYDRTETNAFLNAHVLSEDELRTFISSGIKPVNSIYTFAQKQPGELAIPIKKTGKTYIALTNDFNYKNFVEVEYRTDIIDGYEFDLNIYDAQKNQDINLSIYPNPSNDVVNIKSLEIPINNIQLIDMTGKVVQTFQANQHKEISIDISHINKGLYFVSIYTNEGKIVKKLIKQ